MRRAVVDLKKLGVLWMVVSVLSCVSALAQSGSNGSAGLQWVGTWATAPFGGDPWHTIPTLVGSTVRQIVHTSIAGRALRIHFTNEMGTEPLRIEAASMGLSAGESAVQSGSLHAVTFSGRSSIVIPPGAEAVSDVVEMSTQPLSDLAISIFLPLQRISNVSVHSSAQQVNYMQTGDEVSASRLSAPVSLPSWFFLKSVEVRPVSINAAAIVAFGDSITDGAASTSNANHRWPDVLAARLHDDPATANLSVLNGGIGGNCVLIDRVGPNALARFDRDVLSQPGVRYVIVLEGINDIGSLHSPNWPDYHLSAEDLEGGLSQLAARAHEHGIKIFAATITPYQGAGYATDKGEQIREAVNTWIRTSGVFDGAIDFDKVTQDSQHPLALAAKYDSGDHLHPSDAGYAAMANAIDLHLFQ